MTRTVTTRDRAEMIALAAEGLTRAQISERTGWAPRTVTTYVRTRPGYAPPTATATVAEMLALADEGLCRSDIAAITGWSVQTVGKRIGHLVPARHLNRKPDLARYRRMLAAAEAAEYGTLNAIAQRFGLKNRRVLRVTLVTARRRVAEAQSLNQNAGA